MTAPTAVLHQPTAPQTHQQMPCAGIFLIFLYLFQFVKLIIDFFKTPKNTGSNATAL
jgi:hypothetical protein